MSAYPGFEWDATKKRAHFDKRVPGSSGTKRRRKTVCADSRNEALALWREFEEEVAAEVASPAPAAVASPAPNNPAVAPVVPSLAVTAQPPPTLRAFFDEYYPRIKAALKPRTQRTQESIIKTRLLPVFGDTPLDRITSIAVSDFQTALRNAGYAASYRNDCLRVLKMLLHQAVEREVIAAFPLRTRVTCEDEPLLRQEMETAERRAFLAVFDNHGAFASHLADRQKKGAVRASAHFNVERSFGGSMRGDSPGARRYFARFQWLKPLFTIALETGIRKGDLLALKWTSIHSSEEFIRLVTQKTGVEAVITISSACAAALEECRRRAGDADLVFVDEKGKAISETRVRRAYALAKKLAGMTRPCRFHDLRHTFASRLVSGGHSMRVVATALGHKTTEQTERYAKPSVEAMRGTKGTLDADF